MVCLTTLVPDPEREAAMRRLAELGEEYAGLLAEYVNMSGPRARCLDAEYQLAFGQKEATVMKLEMEINRIRREITIVQAALNHGHGITEEEVEQILAEEFQEYLAKVEELERKVEDAKRLIGCSQSVSAEEFQEIKSLFRSLVKRLHPDLNPGLPPLAGELMRRAMDAYAGNSLPELRLLNDLTDEMMEGKSDFSQKMGECQSGDLCRRIREMEEKIKSVSLRIGELKSHFPFTEEKLLSDPDAVSDRRAALDRRIEELKIQKEELGRRVALLRQEGRANG